LRTTTHRAIIDGAIECFFDLTPMQRQSLMTNALWFDETWRAASIRRLTASSASKMGGEMRAIYVTGALYRLSSTQDKKVNRPLAHQHIICDLWKAASETWKGAIIRHPLFPPNLIDGYIKDLEIEQYEMNKKEGSGYPTTLRTRGMKSLRHMLCSKEIWPSTVEYVMSKSMLYNSAPVEALTSSALTPEIRRRAIRTHPKRSFGDRVEEGRFSHALLQHPSVQQWDFRSVTRATLLCDPLARSALHSVVLSDAHRRLLARQIAREAKCWDPQLERQKAGGQSSQLPSRLQQQYSSVTGLIRQSTRISPKLTQTLHRVLAIGPSADREALALVRVGLNKNLEEMSDHLSRWLSQPTKQVGDSPEWAHLYSFRGNDAVDLVEIRSFQAHLRRLWPSLVRMLMTSPHREYRLLGIQLSLSLREQTTPTGDGSVSVSASQEEARRAPPTEYFSIGKDLTQKLTR